MVNISEFFYYLHLLSTHIFCIVLVHSLSLINGKTVAKDQKFVLVKNRKDPACPVSVLTYFQMVCPPNQLKVFCSSASFEQKFEYITASLAFKSNPNV